MKNVFVAQSGGPSPVINASLQGVLESCFSYDNHMGKVYAGWHGIEGALLEELIDMNTQDPGEIKLLRNTPASGSIGTCRYKLGKDQIDDFDRIIDVFRAHNIGYFFYIGGNDSMDTAYKISELAKKRGLDLIVVGVPKTIDNDIDLIEKSFGFETAFTIANDIIRYAHNVAQGAYNGITLL